ncbi:MAG: hypothetical protein IT576_03570 [Verrucomicrobiales bacterium]|nr:hypothetical protein [Verrucomicrobiales bacterium]
MNDITEIKRLSAPAPRPQSLAWDGSTLWMGSMTTQHLYQIDPAKWEVRWETVAPGVPLGLTWIGDELRVLCGEGPDDHRMIRRCQPGSGFDPEFGIPCPDDTGSQLGYNGHHLHVSQWYRQLVLALDENGQIVRTLSVPHQICGQVHVEGRIYLLTTDDESTNDYWLTRIQFEGDHAVIEDLARIPFPARALAFDGRHFWTNHREQHEMVCFARPD